MDKKKGREKCLSQRRNVSDKSNFTICLTIDIRMIVFLRNFDLSPHQRFIRHFVT